VNLIGEHTDYNDGLALPFAIAAGITVHVRARADGLVRARALDLREHDEFSLPECEGPPFEGEDPPRARGWRAFVRGVVAELRRAGFPLAGADLEIGGELQRGAGLSSSAALEVALCLALLALAGTDDEDRWKIAKLCARVESEWVGAHTGLLDQLSSLFGEHEHALLIDFAAEEIEAVPLRLDGWRLAVLDSGERRALASSGYNERRAECDRACELLGVRSLREARAEALAELPEPLRRRARYVLSENERVRATVAALRTGDLPRVGDLMNEAHASLRDLYEVSTPAVERTRDVLLDARARGARIIGGGFGGSVLGLFAPGTSPPAGARGVWPSAGARVLEEQDLERR
jgi:galactokinase